METIAPQKNKLTCAHCGLPARKEIFEGDLHFCCHGCKTAHSFFSGTEACELPSPGTPRTENELKWLDQPQVIAKWQVGKEGSAVRVRLKIPNIHCVSCVQVLERLFIKKPGIVRSQVQFLRKELEITFHPDQLSFSGLVAYLDSLGYIPDLQDSQNPAVDGKLSVAALLTIRMAVAGFCTGNIMLLSFPEYLGLQDDEYRHFFGWLNLFIALPAVFFSGWTYLQAVYRGITRQILNLDVPIGIGMVATLVLSIYEITTQTGSGYFDSLTGLIFFLLIGRWVQNRTFDFLSFERDFRSYFPLSVLRVSETEEIPILSSDVKVGDLLKIRHGEILPCDSILISEKASMDYSFVTGESQTIEEKKGNLLMAGGRQTSGPILVTAMQEMSRSQLVTLWNNPIFKKESHTRLKTFADQVARYFTPSVLILALLVCFFWLWFEPAISLKAFVSILIIACPCTLSLAYPMALSNAMRLLGKKGMFLKNAEVLETLSGIQTLVFDKTGTLSHRMGEEVHYYGKTLDEDSRKAISAVLSGSTHPLSLAVVQYLGAAPSDLELKYFKEVKGSGVKGIWNSMEVEAGSSGFIGEIPKSDQGSDPLGSRVYIRLQGTFFGYFSVKSAPLPFVPKLMHTLAQKFQIHLLSGDHEEGQTFWKSMFQSLSGTSSFQQTPEGKLAFIQNIQKEGKVVAMIGDGLNDSGALKTADAGIAIATSAHQFTPGSDVILLSDRLVDLPKYLAFARKTMAVVRFCFWTSLVYNAIGLSFAIMGQLQPVVAAILMPASSITVVLLAWIGTEWQKKKFGLG
jgi:Cu+-exporting ATPase